MMTPETIEDTNTFGGGSVVERADAMVRQLHDLGGPDEPAELRRPLGLFGAPAPRPPNRDKPPAVIVKAKRGGWDENSNEPKPVEVLAKEAKEREEKRRAAVKYDRDTDRLWDRLIREPDETNDLIRGISNAQAQSAQTAALAASVGGTGTNNAAITTALKAVEGTLAALRAALEASGPPKAIAPEPTYVPLRPMLNDADRLAVLDNPLAKSRGVLAMLPDDDDTDL
jgi:hypothetical protein